MARQYLIPGQGYINEISTRQFLIPGWGYLSGIEAAPITSSAAITEGADTLSSSDTLTFSGSSGVTEGGDTLAATGHEAVNSASTIESADTMSGSGAMTFSGSAAIVESGDIMGASGSNLTSHATRQFLIPGQGYINTSQRRQYLIPGWGYFNDTVPLNELISAAITEDSDIMAASVLQGNNDAAIIESPDTLAASGINGSSAASGSAAITEGGDTMSAVMNEVLTYTRQFLIPGWGFVNATKARQFLIPGMGYFNDNTPVSINAGSGLVEGADTLAASGNSLLVPITSTGALVEDGDTLSGSISAGSGVSANIFEASDILVGGISSHAAVSGTILEDSDSLAGRVTSHAPTSPDRVFEVPAQPIFFLTTLDKKIAYKTVAEIDLYSIDFTDAISGDTVDFSTWNSPDGMLDIIDPITPSTGNIRSSLIGGGGEIPSKTTALCGVETIEQRQLENSIDFYIRKFNTIPDVIINAGASDVLDYKFNWLNRMIDGSETIVSSAWAYEGEDTALSLSSFPSFVLAMPQSTVVWVSGGTYQAGYVITNTIHTSLGRTLQCSMRYFIDEVPILPGIEDDYVDANEDPYVTWDTGENYIA